METYNIIFKGYRRERKIETLPERSGIYLAYRCIYNPTMFTVDLKELIYIGQATNLRKRLSQHKDSKDFDRYLNQGEELCYAYAFVDKSNLDIVQNALIFAQKPKANTSLKYKFNHEAANFKIEGDCALLKYTEFEIS